MKIKILSSPVTKTMHYSDTDGLSARTANYDTYQIYIEIEAI